MPDKAALDVFLVQAKELLGSGGYIDDPEQMPAYTTSMRNRWVAKTPLVALPRSTEQVSALVKLCAKYRIAIVPQGGNTGLVDGGLPAQEGEIILSLSKLNRIREIDTAAGVVTAEAGVVLQTLSETVAEQGFLFAMSMASNGSAQLGGAISTNAGGTAVLRYGNMRQLVLGLEVVLPDGTIIDGLRKLVKDNTGYNLAQYFIGAEGTLGIITAAAIRLHPLPRQRLVAVAALPDADAALELLQRFRSTCSEYLTAFEIMAQAAIKLAVKQFPEARFPGSDDAPYYLLIELTSASAVANLRDLFEEAAVSMIEQGRMLDAVIAENETQAQSFWYLREHIADALRRQGGGIHFDIALPLAGIAAFLNEVGPMVVSVLPGVTLMPFGHVGDGNLHYNMYAPAGMDAADFKTAKQRIQDIVFTEVTKRHGSISAEHGIGVERKDVLKATKPLAEIDLMRLIKCSLDPQNLLNPGKIFD